MGLLEDCKQYFGTEDLYGVLALEKTATDKDIKSAYRRQSLKVHPDRAEDKDKEAAKRSFQTLSKVHFILSDKTLRQTYDETGIVATDDSFESRADWSEYWRLLFPKITEKDIETFLNKYIGSEEETNDLKEYYMRFEGDLDSISQCVIGFDESRTRQLIQQLIDDEDVPEFEAFVNESVDKRQKRQKKAAKEALIAEKEAKKLKTKSSDDNLVLAIRSRASNFDDMVANLEAKYGGSDQKKSKSKSKTSKRK